MWVLFQLLLIFVSGVSKIQKSPYRSLLPNSDPGRAIGDFEGVLKEMHFYFNCERLSDYFSNSGFGKSRFYIAGFAYVCVWDLPYNLLINVYACARVQNEADVSDYIFSLKENCTRLYIKSYRRNSFTKCTTLTVLSCCYMCVCLFCNDLNFYMWLNFCSSLRLV